jgi:hypothetical protein
MSILKNLTGALSSYQRHLNEVLQLIASSDSVPLLVEYSRDGSGYVREAVLARCVALARPELLAVVAERLNDWVPQVRSAARTALVALLPFVPAPQLMAALPAILRLHSGGRGDYAAWLEEFEHILLQSVTVDDIRAAATGNDLQAARAAVHLLDKHALLEPAAVIELILHRSDDIVLALHGADMCRRLPLAQREALYRVASHSHFGAVRTLAMRALLSTLGDDRLEIAIAALMDKQSSVRHTAAHYLVAQGFDVAAHYRGLLEQGDATVKRLQMSLIMLAALRDVASLELVQSFVHSAYPALRLTALSAWFKMSERDKDAIALTAMHDASPRVRKFAVQLVLRHGAYIPFSAILQQLAVSEDVVLVMQLAETNRWNWLECAARVCLQRGVEEARRLGLGKAFAKWFASPQWQSNSDHEQRFLLLSEPVISAFGQLLSPQQLAGLREQLLR